PPPPTPPLFPYTTLFRSARGSKDGSQLTAEDVVFGTFQTKAGYVTAIDLHNHEFTIEDAATKKALTVKLAGESKLKVMPAMRMRSEEHTSELQSPCNLVC